MAEKRFFVGVKGVIIKDDKVLLIKGNQKVEGRDHWEVPGGRIDTNESIDAALMRELQEEVPGISNIKKHEILHAHRIEHDVKDDTSLVLIFFRVTADVPDDIVLSEEHVEAEWLACDEAIKRAHPTVAVAVQAAFDGLRNG